MMKHFLSPVRSARILITLIPTLLLPALITTGCSFNKTPTPELSPEDLRSAAGSLFVQREIEEGTPESVIQYAEAYVRQQIEAYHGGWEAFAPENAVSGAKITGITQINTGTAAENTSINLYLLEYRLRVVGNIENVLAGGMSHEAADGENWLTEWGSTGQPYLLLYCDDSGAETIWQPICVTNTDVIQMDYSTSDMLEQYGDPYPAACMELYYKHIEESRAIAADFASEVLLSSYDAFDEFEERSDEYAQRILLTAREAVTGFRFLEISFDESQEQEIQFIVDQELYAQETFTPDRPLAVWVSFPGTFPTRAIQYTGQDGAIHSYAIVMSGKDGSLLLSEIELLYR